MKNSSLIIGGKKGFYPHLNYRGRVPGLSPRVYAYAWDLGVLIDINTLSVKN